MLFRSLAEIRAFVVSGFQKSNCPPVGAAEVLLILFSIIFLEASMADFTFDRVVVFQSLQPHEFKSGTELKLYLEGLSEDSSHPIPIELYEFSDLIGFKQQLLVLCNSIELGQHPILHLEMHGLADASGLVFSDNSKITWSDLQPIQIGRAHV